MRTIMARSPHDASFSFSKRHFQWIIGRGGGGGGEGKRHGEGDDDEEEVLGAFSSASSSSASLPGDADEAAAAAAAAATESAAPARRKGSSSSGTGAGAVRRLGTAIAAAIGGAARRRGPAGLGPRLTGTLFGPRRGHVRLAFQVDPRACPALLIELATPTSALVREMASGLVRIALECERGSRVVAGGGGSRGKKCGFAVRRECGPGDWRVLRAVEPVSTGAGVLPGDPGSAGEMMYMRARFERVVGSRDSEAFYMMNPDHSGGPELSIYLLRV
ncbi:protein MIZU-KUSSEI 1-like [Ananas comosus]|uniref:Protein MIZU-KUSSEI 1-like n=1 Tax=Ananas comosus TaxID=4615 RepID=A0A6P5FZR9_ANACO|nr:protein MIZU-KUSSEI 1-like [Ananas comosus]